MPLAIDPNETFELVLESDKDKPRESQPRFIYRHLTCRQWMNVAKFRDNLEILKGNKATLDDMVDKVKETATTNLIGWVNMIGPDGMMIPFDLAKFEDIIGLDEANELIIRLEEHRLMPKHKKKLDSQSASGTVESVKDAKD